MAVNNPTQGKKWINATVVIGCFLLGIVTISFLDQLGEWFDLEAKIKYFDGWAQGIALFVGLLAYLFTVKNNKANSFLSEVYGELIKVVWPGRDDVFRLTIGIVIGISIVSGLLVCVDLAVRKLLELLY